MALFEDLSMDIKKDPPPVELVSLVGSPAPANPIQTVITTRGWEYLRWEVVRRIMGKLVNTDRGFKIWKLHIRIGWY
jgi:hypothetical protein